MKNTKVSEYSVSVFSIPTRTDFESDGTLTWRSTTMILVELFAKDIQAIGYTYGNAAIARCAEGLLEKCVMGHDVRELPEIWGNLVREVRNDGKLGLTAMAIAAIDIALWDLKAKSLEISLTELLGQVRPQVEAYGSGGFTSLTFDELEKEMRDWAQMGIRRFKMKVGTSPREDPARIHFVRDCIGADATLMIDANEAFTPSRGYELIKIVERENVSWFEQPIDDFNRRGLVEMRQRLPTSISLTTGEYFYDSSQVLAYLQDGCADVIQLDVTRCKGVTGFLQAAALCAAYRVPISTHCAPALHVALGCAISEIQHLEYFYDHSRIENLFFEGAPRVHDGFLKPDGRRPGLGLVLQHKEMARYKL